MKQCEKCPEPAVSETAKYCAACRRAIQVEQGRKQGKRASKGRFGQFYIPPKEDR